MPDLRKIKRRGRRSRIPRPLPPRGIQLQYLGKLRGVLAVAKRLVDERLVSRLPDLIPAPAVLNPERQDASRDPHGRVNSLLQQAQAAFHKATPTEKLQKITAAIARATSEHQKEQLFRQVKAAIGVKLETIADRKLGGEIRKFTAENISLIKMIAPTYFQQAEQTTLAGLRLG